MPVNNNGCRLDIISFIVKFPSCNIDFQPNISWSFYVLSLAMRGDCSFVDIGGIVYHH